MKFKSRILKILFSFLISLAGSIIIFNISITLLNSCFPAIVIIDNEIKHIMPIGNLIWSLLISITLFVILIYSLLKHTEMKINILSLLQKQVLAAKCFSKYCIEKGIYHENINELVDHLLSIQSTKNLNQWEKNGSNLKITGRGDELPVEIEIILKSKDRNTFIELLEYTVEVGIAEFYGAKTTKSDIYLKKCIEILKKNKISIPEIKL